MIHAENHLSLKIDMTLKLSKDATLKAIPNDSEKYSILLISGVSNVTVTGGTFSKATACSRERTRLAETDREADVHHRE